MYILDVVLLAIDLIVIDKNIIVPTVIYYEVSGCLF